AIATDPAYADMGLGRSIVHYLIDKAKRQGSTRVFALTIRTQDWFEALGFRETDQETLPEKKRLLYDHNRNSKVFALDLQ
ncbi:MAG: GNAT family N-acetyltransferase, partial [Treponema sp.]|nr:GNAT family N-acetyltransferase [Treponema sp.]